MKLFSSDIKKNIVDTIKDMKQFLVFSAVLITIINSASVCVAIDNKKNSNNDDDDLPVMSQDDEIKDDDSNNIIYSNMITLLAYDFDDNSIKTIDNSDVVSNNINLDETSGTYTDDTCKGVDLKVEKVTVDNTSATLDLPIKKMHCNDQRYKNITADTMDFFSIEDKIKFICDKYNLTDFEFKVIASTVYHEACKNNYDDAYRVINTIYNRTISKTWVDWIASLTGIDGGSMYAQVIAPNQFDGCLSTSGYDYDDLLSEVSYDGTKLFEITLDAMFDFLISEKSVHNFLSFKGCDYSISESEKMKEDYGITDWVNYTDFGNTYHNPLTEDDVIEGYTLASTQGNILTRKRG